MVSRSTQVADQPKAKASSKKPAIASAAATVASSEATKKKKKASTAVEKENAETSSNTQAATPAEHQKAVMKKVRHDLKKREKKLFKAKLELAEEKERAKQLARAAEEEEAAEGGEEKKKKKKKSHSLVDQYYGSVAHNNDTANKQHTIGKEPVFRPTAIGNLFREELYADALPRILEEDPDFDVERERQASEDRAASIKNFREHQRAQHGEWLYGTTEEEQELDAEGQLRPIRTEDEQKAYEEKMDAEYDKYKQSLPADRYHAMFNKHSMRFERKALAFAENVIQTIDLGIAQNASTIMDSVSVKKRTILKWPFAFAALRIPGPFSKTLRPFMNHNIKIFKRYRQMHAEDTYLLEKQRRLIKKQNEANALLLLVNEQEKNGVAPAPAKAPAAAPQKKRKREEAPAPPPVEEESSSEEDEEQPLATPASKKQKAATSAPAAKPTKVVKKK